MVVSRARTWTRAMSARKEKPVKSVPGIPDALIKQWTADLPQKVDTGICTSILDSDEFRYDTFSGIIELKGFDALERGRVAGFNVKHNGIVREAYARISRNDYLNLMVTRLPEAPGYMESILGGLPDLSDAFKERYREAKKFVLQDLGKHTRVIVVPRIPESLDEEDFDIDDEVAYTVHQELLKPLPSLKGRRKIKYSLPVIYDNDDIKREYKIPHRIFEGSKRLMATRPDLAAKTLQSTMNKLQSEFAVSVVPGLYGNDTRTACTIFLALGRSYPDLDRKINTTTIGGKILLWGGEFNKSWSVSGPLRRLKEMECLYWMVMKEGPYIPSFMFDLELVKLGIDIDDGTTGESPEVIYHVGKLDSSAIERGIQQSVLEKLSYNQRETLQTLGSKLAPVIDSDSGQQVATSVRVTGKAALVNTHVIEGEFPISLNGNPVACLTQLARDVWAVESDAKIRPWTLREPVVGEDVFVCYLVNGNTLATSNVLKIVSINDASFALSMDPSISRGCSGGAIIAMSDMALLGVHSYSTAYNLLAYRFDSTHMVRLMEATVPESPEAHKCADAKCFLDSQMSARGTTQLFEETLGSLFPVFHENEQVGVAVSTGDNSYTMSDATLPLCTADGKLLRGARTSVPDVQYIYDTPVGVQDTINYVRPPNLSEPVFILAKRGDDTMVYNSRVLHIGLDAKNFTVSAADDMIPGLVGGIILGSDAACLGQFGNIQISPVYGKTHVCWPLKRTKVVKVETYSDIVKKQFPYLHLDLWPEQVFDELSVHSSVGKYPGGEVFNAGQKPLANVGDNSAKWALHKYLRQMNIPHTQWVSKVQEYQNLKKWGEIAWTFNLAPNLKTSLGVKFPNTAKAYSEMTQALIGAVSLYEDNEILERVLIQMELVPK